MTAAQRATLDWALDECEPDSALADALRAALGTCGTCAHADTVNSVPGWAWCAAEGDYAAFPFIYQHMPLGERCTGYTPKEGA